MQKESGLKKGRFFFVRKILTKWRVELLLNLSSNVLAQLNGALQQSLLLSGLLLSRCSCLYSGLLCLLAALLLTLVTAAHSSQCYSYNKNHLFHNLNDFFS